MFPINGIVYRHPCTIAHEFTETSLDIGNTNTSRKKIPKIKVFES